MSFTMFPKIIFLCLFSFCCEAFQTHTFTDQVLSALNATAESRILVVGSPDIELGFNDDNEKFLSLHKIAEMVSSDSIVDARGSNSKSITGEFDAIIFVYGNEWVNFRGVAKNPVPSLSILQHLKKGGFGAILVSIGNLNYGPDEKKKGFDILSQWPEHYSQELVQQGVIVSKKMSKRKRMFFSTSDDLKEWIAKNIIPQTNASFLMQDAYIQDYFEYAVSGHPPKNNQYCYYADVQCALIFESPK
jgi:hypothetical protein